MVEAAALFGNPFSFCTRHFPDKPSRVQQWRAPFSLANQMQSASGVANEIRLISPLLQTDRTAAVALLIRKDKDVFLKVQKIVFYVLNYG